MSWNFQAGNIQNATFGIAPSEGKGVVDTITSREQCSLSTNLGTRTVKVNKQCLLNIKLLPLIPLIVSRGWSKENRWYVRPETSHERQTIKDKG